MTPEGIRLQKILSEAGVASRRRAEELIRQGRVMVDGKPARLGDRALPDQHIVVDGSRIQTDSTKRYLALNKPAGIVTTVSDPHGRTTVLDLIGVGERIYPIGRLDTATEGLLLLTNDGELAHRLAHPSFEVPKVYVARVEGAISGDSIRKLKRGIRVDGDSAKADSIRVLASRRSPPAASVVEVTLHEGRKHIVRRMLAEVGHPVRHLVRNQVGPIRLGRLASGSYRNLTRKEVESLYELVDL